MIHEVDQEILSRIPHRPPFLWVDSIISVEDDLCSMQTCKKFPEDLDLFAGHYPNHPLMPGVILCEAIFQTGALLMSYRLESQPSPAGSLVPVLTRIENAKFKRQVLPGDTAVIQVKLKEVLANVSFLKGTLKVHGKTAVQVEFGCAVTPAG